MYKTPLNSEPLTVACTLRFLLIHFRHSFAMRPTFSYVRARFHPSISALICIAHEMCSPLLYLRHTHALSALTPSHTQLPLSVSPLQSSVFLWPLVSLGSFLPLRIWSGWKSASLQAWRAHSKAQVLCSTEHNTKYTTKYTSKAHHTEHVTKAPHLHMSILVLRMCSKWLVAHTQEYIHTHALWLNISVSFER